MPRFVIWDDSGRHGFNSLEDIVDNLRYEIATIHGDHVKLRELRRLRKDPDWEKTPGPSQSLIESHESLIEWASRAQPGERYKEQYGRTVYCLKDSVGDVRWG